MAVMDENAECEFRLSAQALCDYCAERDLISWKDRLWAYNTVLDCVGATRPAPDRSWILAGRCVHTGPTLRFSPLAGAAQNDMPDVAEETPASLGDISFRVTDFDLEGTLGVLAEAAVTTDMTEDTTSGRDRIAMRIMGALMPRPSAVIDEFNGRLGVGEADAATSWFYRLCCDAGYVRRSAIARNIQWNTSTRWGDLEITINLSKPEKDPREIAAAGVASTEAEVYPVCQLCIENEGYPGRSVGDGGAHPARQNLRIVPITLGGDCWGLQYSPYAYFNEHCIAMSAHHRPMHIDAEALTCLFDFVDILPHYFIGSNADLPIVGGSILSHDHFQGGAHEFPMMKASIATEFPLSAFPGVTGAVIEWPLSVLRLRGRDREELLAASVHVIDAWRAWTDESVGIIAHDADGTPHNTVTPIVRRVNARGKAGGDLYEVFLALRCNITSKEHPLGVFHPHAEHHHIKRENIGLIEVMGLAILPPRLKDEIAAVESILLEGSKDDSSPDDILTELLRSDAAASHATWAAGIVRHRRSEISPNSVHDILNHEIGIVFSHVLEDAGVFKWDTQGRIAQQRFIESL